MPESFGKRAIGINADMAQSINDIADEDETLVVLSLMMMVLLERAKG